MHIDGKKVRLKVGEINGSWDIDVEEWEIKPFGNLMRHTPSGMNFEIDRDKRTGELDDFYAKLIHVDDGQPMLERERVVELAMAALVLYIADLGFLDLNFLEPERPAEKGPRPYKPIIH